MKTYKIKLEDKAAFINRLEKMDIKVDTQQIKDNKIDGYFEFTADNPETIDAVKSILKQSPKIDTVKENKITISQLRNIIKEELKKNLEVQTSFRIFK